MTMRDIWNGTDLGKFGGSFTTGAIGGHDSRFYLVTPAS
jgi:hypothetical protein